MKWIYNTRTYVHGLKNTKTDLLAGCIHYCMAVAACIVTQNEKILNKF